MNSNLVFSGSGSGSCASCASALSSPSYRNAIFFLHFSDSFSFNVFFPPFPLALPLDDFVAVGSAIVTPSFSTVDVSAFVSDSFDSPVAVVDCNDPSFSTSVSVVAEASSFTVSSTTAGSLVSKSCFSSVIPSSTSISSSRYFLLEAVPLSLTCDLVWGFSSTSPSESPLSSSSSKYFFLEEVFPLPLPFPLVSFFLLVVFSTEPESLSSSTFLFFPPLPFPFLFVSDILLPSSTEPESLSSSIPFFLPAFPLPFAAAFLSGFFSTISISPESLSSSIPFFFPAFPLPFGPGFVSGFFSTISVPSVSLPSSKFFFFPAVPWTFVPGFSTSSPESLSSSTCFLFAAFPLPFGAAGFLPFISTDSVSLSSSKSFFLPAFPFALVTGFVSTSSPAFSLTAFALPPLAD